MFQSVNKKHVSHETFRLFWDNLPIKFTKTFIFQNRKFTSPFSLHLFYNLKTAITNGFFRNYDPLKQYYLFNPKKIPDRRLIIPQKFFFQLVLHILILAALQPQLLSRIQSCQISLTSH